ncbi:DNA polymerase-3 subunit epsilon [Succinivibrio dextrinosolvens]|uniref:3'-5' exonuclease n=1 Tax=Succinivibrio dextrinosolvens TaxID=83771 RepID=UPI0008EEAC89|nr:3'-5' exonuclease [Succinivibrio dextrinosolvens]SFS38630.1 DNA polymerase-3 subunit epsilon [Succinivibrio dextrinosolvens]
MIPTDLSNILILDTETTGLSNTDEILQLSVIDGLGNVLWDRYYRPLNHTSWYYAQKVNHISPEFVADKPNIAEDAEKLIELFRGCELVLGYNTNFDLRMLCNNVPQFNELVLKSEDVHNIYRKYEKESKLPHLEKHDLGSVSSFLGFIPEDNEAMHNSLTDVKATLFIYKKILKVLSN